MKIGLHALCKNESHNVDQFIENCKDFDDVIVIDTGSTDNTVELLKAAGIRVIEHPVDPENFDFAEIRNLAENFLDPEILWCGFLDFNERFENFNKIWFDDLDCTAVYFDRYDDFGNNDIKNGHEDHIRFYKRKLYEWKNAVHEDLASTTSHHQISRLPIKVIKKIHRTESKEKFYASICEREIKKDPTNLHYYWFVIKYYFTKQNKDKLFEYGLGYINHSSLYHSPSWRASVLRLLSIAALSEVGDEDYGIALALSAFSEILGVNSRIDGADWQSDVTIDFLMSISQKTEIPEIALLASRVINPTEEIKKFRKEKITLLLGELYDEPNA